MRTFNIGIVSILGVVALLLDVPAAIAQSCYKADHDTGYLTYTLTGADLYGASSAATAGVPGTSITLYGDAVDAFEWDKAKNWLRNNPQEIGKRYYMWLDGGEWKSTYAAPPYIQPCGTAVDGGGNGSGTSSTGGTSSGGGCDMYLGMKIGPDHPMYSCGN